MTVPPTGPATTPAAITPNGVDGLLAASERAADSNAAFLAVLNQQVGPAGGDQRNPRHTGKNDAHASRHDETKRLSPQLNPTAAAVAELASPGPVKPVMAQVSALQSGHADSGAAPSAASATAGGAKGRSAPEAAGQCGNKASTAAAGANADANTQPGRGTAGVQASAGTARPNGESTKREANRSQAEKAVSARVSAGASARQVTSQPRTVFSAALRSTGATTGPSSPNTGVSRIAGPTAQASDARATVKPDRSQTPRFKLEQDEAKVAAQFGRGLAAALRQNGGTVTLRLQPEALGDLKIRLSMVTGRVGATFEVGTDQARQLLGKAMDTLKSALEARGLTVDRLDVQVAERPVGHAPTADSAQDFGGADGGRDSGAGSEHPERDPPNGLVGMPPESDEAEPMQGSWMGHEPGGALRIRLDALA